MAPKYFYNILPFMNKIWKKPQVVHCGDWRRSGVLNEKHECNELLKFSKNDFLSNVTPTALMCQILCWPYRCVDIYLAVKCSIIIKHEICCVLLKNWNVLNGRFKFSFMLWSLLFRISCSSLTVFLKTFERFCV